MSRDSTVRLVCFDLGGVVVRICRSWPEACDAAGLEVRTCSCLNEQLLRAWQTLSVDLQLGRMDNATFAERFSLALSGVYSPEEIDSVSRAWVLGEYCGIGELIDQLHTAGLETAALSNTSAEHWRELVKMPAISRLKHRFGSHQLELMKPDPAIYRTFEKQVGRSGSEIAFFDDTDENVRAARQAGWFAQAIDPAGSPPEQIVAALQTWKVAGFG